MSATPIRNIAEFEKAFLACRTSEAVSTHPASTYILSLFKPDDPIAIMLLRGEEVIHWFGSAQEVASPKYLAKLQKKNQEGFSVYVCMNPISGGKRRVKENVTEIRAAYLDIDANGPAAVEKISKSPLVPKPHFILESSPGKFYVIWSVDGIQPAEQEALNKAMIQEFGGDPAASDMVRVLRLPGFVNCKPGYESKPVVQIVKNNFDGHSYTRKDFRIDVNPVSAETHAPFVAVNKIYEGEGRNREMFRAASSLRARGWSDEAVRAAIIAQNQVACRPPVDRGELDTLIASALRPEYKAKDGKWRQEKLVNLMPDEVPLPSDEAVEDAQTAYEVPPAELPHDVQEIEAHWNLDMVPLSHIKAEIQPWLWENRLPMNALSNISGIADMGKSLVLYDILARISTGADFPDGAKNPFGGPKKVLLFFSEGSIKTTVKPRMMVMKANMDNIIAVKSVKVNQNDDAQKRQFCLDSDLALLRSALVKNPDIAVIAFDTITSYVGDERNINSPQDVRAVLTPLGELAEERHATVISIVHFSKNTLTDAIHRTGGASTWVDFPRAAWCCSADRSSEDKGTFVFSRIKSNLGKRVGGLTYRIEETFIEINGKQTPQPKLIWGTGTDRGADEILNTEREVGKTDTDAAKEWLETNFPDDDARPAKETKNKALREGVSDDGFDRARSRLRMQSKPISGRWWMRRNQNKDNPWHEHLQEESRSLSDSSSQVEVY